MVSQRKKFDRWSTTVPATTQCLIQLVRDEVVPQITQYGFDWIADYAEGKAGQVGANVIPLQIRAGDAWPTVEIFFRLRAGHGFESNLDGYAMDSKGMTKVC